MEKNGKISNDWANMDDIPKQSVISILSEIRDIDSEDDLSDILYKKLSKSLKIDPASYLKYENDERCLHRPHQSYKKDGLAEDNPAQIFRIIGRRPHDALGDLSVELVLVLVHKYVTFLQTNKK